GARRRPAPAARRSAGDRAGAAGPRGGGRRLHREPRLLLRGARQGPGEGHPALQAEPRVPPAAATRRGAPLARAGAAGIRSGQVSHRPFLLAAFVLVGAAGAQEGVLTLQAQAERALAEGRFAAAAEAYLALARAEPDRVAWSLGAAEALARDGRFQDALEHLDGALQRTPGHVGLRVLLAKVNVLHAEELGRGGRRDAHVLFAYQEAAQVARAVVDEHPDERDARLIL